MKLLARAAMLLALLSSLSFVSQAQDDSSKPPFIEYDASKWETFISPIGHFSVMMPGEPGYTKLEVESEIGLLPSHAYLVRTSAGNFLVNVTELPIAPPSPQEMKALLKDIFGDVRKDKNKKIWVERDLKIAGHDGLEVLIEDGDMMLVDKVFMTRNVVYHLMLFVSPATMFKNGKPSSSPSDHTEFYQTLATKFFDSFKLNPVIETAVLGGRVGSGSETVTTVDGEVDRMLRDMRERNQTSSEKSTVVSGGVLNGKALSKPVPEYPKVAVAARADGVVEVQILIDEEGKVIAAQARSGHPLLQASAVKAAREARFSQTLLSGKPVFVTGIVTYKFTLTGK